MCGIIAIARLRDHAGFVNSQASGTHATPPAADWRPKLDKSLQSIAHRGPDASAAWCSSDGQAALGHCRLSINDLSEQGNQPLHDDDNVIHAVVNGEIYDCDRLREQCVQQLNYRFKSHSDSELVVALYKQYGAPEFLEHLRGEFAFVLYDGRTGEFIAARDRCGIKPLFWVILDEPHGRFLLLASEMKAFLALGWKPEWDVDHVVLGANVFGDMTDFKGVMKVRPGHYLQISSEGDVSEHQYWDFDYANKHDIDTRSPDQLVQTVRESLLDSIRLRIKADVPVGVYLSGGLDSSALVGMAKYLIEQQGQSMGSCDTKDRIACFTIAFDKDSGVDESDIAARTADFLGVDMFVQHMDEEELAQNFEDCIWHNEQICFNLNTVGKFCLSQLVRAKGFKVVLTGEGSDEIFCGYPWHLPDILLEPDYSRPDLPLQKAPDLRDGLLANTLSSYSAFTLLTPVAPDPIEADLEQGLNKTFTPVGNNLMQSPPFFFAPNLRERYSLNDKLRMQMNQWPPQVQRKIREEWHPIHTSMYSWSKSILPNWLFTTVGDRGEMAHSVEARPPFLDHELVHLANHIPPSFKQFYDPVTASFTDKWVLREAAKPFVTEELYRRKKQPYLAPVQYHTGKPVHALLRRLVTQHNVDGLGFLDWPVVSGMMDRAFGEEADLFAFKGCLNVAGWVVMSQRFGIPPATIDEARPVDLEAM